MRRRAGARRGVRLDFPPAIPSEVRVRLIGLVLALGLTLVPLAGEAQQAGKVWRIGVLYPGADNSLFRANFDGFRQALGTAGYVERRNLAFDLRFGDGRALAPLAAELTTFRPDLVLAIARSGVMAMHAATSTIPVVALDLESDPVASGFVKTIPRPGGNLTGVFMDFPELAGKWLEILQTTIPALARVAVLWDPATGSAQLDAAHRAARILKLALYPIEARTTAEIGPAFREAMRNRPSGMIVLTSPIFNSGRREIVALAARYRLPTLVPFPGYEKDGGLVSYGPEVMTMYAQAGTLAVKILSGTPPTEIPVERPTRFTFAFNLKTAKALGLTIPQTLLLRADQVIE
ncbi:MAG: hypothetical protein DME00_23370 [Candidatus Rokuibacteriota bacterium]|nr:MAG: hypothetical protein DME00_23370 [Candidatus Rokubacteria bacterium]